MIASSWSLGGKLLVAVFEIRIAMILSRFDESNAGITDRLLASSLSDMITLPDHGTDIWSAYLAWYSIRGFATARLISSVALS